MQASEAYQRMIAEFSDIGLTYWGNEKSKVDETKQLIDMFNSWLNLFESFPDMRIGSMTKYNIEKDFPGALSTTNEIRNDDNSSRPCTGMSGIQPSHRSQRT